MFPPLRPRTSVLRGIAAGACAAALLVTAACGSSSGSSSAASGSSGSSASSGGSSSAVPAASQDLVKKRLAVTDWKTDAPAIPDVAKVKGGSILYVPISLKIPVFQQVLTGMQQSVGHLGMTVSGCDANYAPAGVAACVNQALAQHVSAVVFDNVPLVLAGQGADQLKAAHIPIVEGETEAQPGDAQVSYLDTGGPEMIQSMADWVAVDSGGKADVLVVEQADSPLQVHYVDAYLMPEFQKACPACKTTIIKTSAAQLQNLGSEVSAALLKDPSITYAAVEFDQIANNVLTGLKNSPNGSKIKLAAAIGNLSSIQRVQAGQQAWTALADNRFAGWALTDQVLRMLTGGAPLQTADSPWRMFDTSNIGSIKVAQSSIDDESLWGGDTFSATYLKLWGVS
jgi:ribose transport system substrate-binding protein